MPREAACDEQFGRGLTLVEALADKWGTQPRLGPGKTVWAEWSSLGHAVTLSGTDPLTSAKE